MEESLRLALMEVFREDQGKEMKRMKIKLKLKFISVWKRKVLGEKTEERKERYERELNCLSFNIVRICIFSKK